LEVQGAYEDCKGEKKRSLCLVKPDENNIIEEIEKAGAEEKGHCKAKRGVTPISSKFVVPHERSSTLQNLRVSGREIEGGKRSTGINKVGYRRSAACY